MKVLIKHKRSTLISMVVLMVFAIIITIGSKGDEKSTKGYTIYKSKSAVTHINQMDINVSTPKKNLRFFPDSRNVDITSEMKKNKMDFLSLSQDYEDISMFYVLDDVSDISEEYIYQRIDEAKGNYDLTSDITHELITIGDNQFHKVCYSVKDLIYFYHGVVIEYFLEHDGKCLEIRNLVEYENEPNYEEEIEYIESQVEPYLAEYSFGSLSVKQTKDNVIWAKWKKLDFAPWVVLLPFLYALICGITFTGTSEKVYDVKSKRYRFVGDEGSGWNEEFLSLNTSKMLLGFFAVVIVFHHLVQEIGVDNAGILFILENYGVCFVGMFFFFSGFGLYESFKVKKNYLKGFLKKRLPSVLIPFYITNLIFCLYELSESDKYDFQQMLTGFLGIRLLNSHTWYIVEIVILYIIFMVIFRLIKNQKVSISFLFVTVLIMMTGSLLLGHGEKWFQGEWWYNTTLLFPIGVLFSYNKDNFVYYMKRYYRILLPVFVVLFFGLNRLTNYVLVHFSYWSETALDKGYDDKLICLIVQCPMVVAFVILILLLGLKLKIGNKVLGFLGNISLELYLIHNLFISFFFVIKGTGAFYSSVVVCSIIAATILHLLNSFILCQIYGKKFTGITDIKNTFKNFVEKNKADYADFKVNVRRSIKFAKENKRTVRILMFRNAVCIFLCILSILPVLILIFNGTQTRYALARGISFIPGGHFAENLRDVKGYLESMGLNLYSVIVLSCAISLTCTFLGTYIGAICAFGFEYYKFKGKGILWKFLVCTLMVPLTASSVGFLKLVSMLHLFNSLIPIIMAGITIPSSVYFIRMYLRTISLTEIMEAARIDGCTEIKTFNKIIIPIIKPALLLQLTINFANSWNNTLYQNIILLDVKKKSISVFLAGDSFGAGEGSSPFVYCFLLVATIPSLIVFILFSHGITTRINLGSVKE